MVEKTEANKDEYADFKPPAVKKKLVQPLLNAKIAVGVTLYIKATGPMYVGKPQKDAKENEKPADLMPALDMRTGETGEIIVSAVVKSALEETYPDDGYVGHGFAITKLPKPEGKRYFQYTVDEVEVN